MTVKVTIWHNPRCSKSRITLNLLEEAGAEIAVRRYLDDAPTLSELTAAKAALGLTALEMMRSKEPLFKELGLSKTDPEDRLLAAMAANPKLIERPVVFKGDRAVLGRPPEAVKSLL